MQTEQDNRSNKVHNEVTLYYSKKNTRIEEY